MFRILESNSSFGFLNMWLKGTSQHYPLFKVVVISVLRILVKKIEKLKLCIKNINFDFLWSWFKANFKTIFFNFNLFP